MASGLLNPRAWLRPLGFVKNERENESELEPAAGELDIVTIALLLVLDLLTLPLALLWLAGVGRDDRSSG